MKKYEAPQINIENFTVAEILTNSYGPENPGDEF